MQFENTISYSLGSPDKPLCLSDDLFFCTISLTFLCTLIPQHYYNLNFLICHVEEFTYLSVAKQTREINDRHGKVSANRKQSTSLLECSAEVQPILCKDTN